MPGETVGAAVRRLRKERDISLRQLSKLAPVDQGHLSKIENDKRHCSLAMAKALDAALDAGGQLVALIKADQAKRVRAAVPFDPMKRRTIVRFGLTASATATVGSGLALEAVRHGLAAEAAADERSAVAVDEWQEIVGEYGRRYMTTPASDLLAALTIDLLAIQEAMNRERDNDTSLNELRRSGASLAAITALTLGNLGQLPESRRWWRSARQVADQSGNINTAVWIRGYEVVRALYEEHPAFAVLRFSEDAEALGANALPASLPELIGGKAQTLAMLGRADEAEAALCRLRDIFGALPDSVTRDDTSLLGWGETELRFTESFVYSFFGDIGKAEAAQRHALRLYPAANSRGRAQIELMRALCLVRSGDSAGGAQHAQTILTSLPVADHTRPVVGLGQKILAAVPKTRQHLTAVTELRDCLVTATSA